MVAVLKPNRSLKDTFYYNENKLKEGEAVCLLAENYPRQAGDLSELDKLGMLQKMAAIRPGVKVNSLHISLNFDPSEVLSGNQLRAIAREYMEQIGFGNQPYLVYQHFDAAHPHIHLVTTNIQADGRGISLHHLGIQKSEPARKMIEDKYGLVRAEDQGKQAYELKPVPLEKVVYGRSQTKRAIGNVLLGVLDNYKYSSLAELNAVLSLYNVRAERGSENSRIYKHRGLVYRLLDEQGNLAGVPIKASSFYQKPGLNYLEQRFYKNVIQKKQYQIRLKNIIDLALINPQSLSIDAFKSALKKQGVDLVLRQNIAGQIYGLTYIDHQTKCVFNGSALGKNYSANAMQDRLGLTPNSGSGQVLQQDPQAAVEDEKPKNKASKLNNPGEKETPTSNQSDTGQTSFAELLFRPENTWEPDPYDLTRRRKKRKRKQNINPQQ